MPKNEKKKFKGRKASNEFNEILNAKLGKNPAITQDDITDLTIDLELHNKAALKEMKRKNSKG